MLKIMSKATSITGRIEFLGARDTKMLYVGWSHNEKLTFGKAVFMRRY